MIQRQCGSGPTSHVPPRSSLVVALAGTVAVATYLTALGVAMNDASYEIWSAMVLAPALLIISTPIIRHVSDGDPRLRRILFTALVLKLAGAYVLYLVSFEIYDGVVDATRYHEWGVDVAEALRRDIWSVDVGRDATSTGFIRLFTGYVYFVIGDSKLGGFFFYSWLGFWGTYFFYRAFCIGFPAGDHRRYAKLILFLPSMLFWPSSIGKEAWMTLALGLSAYAASKLLRQQRGGIPLLALGLWATAVVRSHMAVLIFGSIAVAYLLRRPRRATSTSPVAKTVGILGLALASTLVVGRFEEQFDVQGVSGESVDDVLSRTAEQTNQGESSFEASRSRSLLDLPHATVAVLFRPFPFEARSFQAFLASLEGVLLMVLVVRSFQRFKSLPGLFLRVPYVALAATYTLGFIFAFSTFGNFGILARQRVQLFPFALVLLALPRPIDDTARRSRHLLDAVA